MNEFINQGLEFFKACNNFIAGVIAFITDPLPYLFAYGFWLALFIAVVGLFLKACGFKSEKYFVAGTVASMIFKIARLIV